MQYLAYISMAFLGMQLCNVLINFIFRQKIKKTELENSELVSVLIPARNEQHNIGNLLESFGKCTHKNLELIVCNDHSTDLTEEIIQHFAQSDKRIRLIQSEALPPGWLGKNHACNQLAEQAKGNYLLFVDADVLLMGNIINDAIRYAKKYKLGLLSVFPKQIQLSVGEKLSVPLMNYILLTLLPLIFVRISPFKSHSAANGQFMLFDAEPYKKWHPHKQFKNSPIEDISIARYFKSKKVKIACLTGEERIQCRMYTTYKQALNGFSKNIFMFFGNVPVLAFLFWLLAALGIVTVSLYNMQLAYLYLLLIAMVQVFYAFICKQSMLATVLLFPLHLLFMFHVMVKALIFKQQKKYLWKGRNIY